MQTLQLTKQDLVILDRETNIGQPIFEEAQKARLGVVVHAEHFSANNVDDQYILWNNYYDYQFTNADKVDFFIVATDRQKEILAEQFAKYTNHRPAIYTIPVGSLASLPQNENRTPFSMITASRLATEKHIDWLIRAVVCAKKELPELSFDIYGNGGEEGKLRSLIDELGATDYIHLKGHANLEEIYKNYEVYLSASTSEGFGLTLMEAAGAGLALLGFDARYGNPTFIKEGENGFLVPYSETVPEEELVKELADKLVQLFESDLAPFHQASYELASSYLASKVQEVWKETLMEMGQLGGKEI